MANTYTKNQTPATGAEAMYNLKTLLKAAGWTVPRSSDGTTYNSSGDQITTTSSGAGGMANNSAWFELKAPGSNRSFTVQRGTGNTSWRIKYSPDAGFSSGSPGATQTGSSTNETVLHGGGTDASPTYASFFPTDNTYRQNIMADNASPYGWWMAVWITGGSDPRTIFALDPVGDAPAEDTDPYVVLCKSSTSCMIYQSASGDLVTETTGTSTARAWIKLGMGGAGNVGVAAAWMQTAAGVVVPNNLGSNGHNSKADHFPLFWCRRSSATSPNGYKGRSTLFKWTGQDVNTGDRFSVSTTGDRIVLGDVVTAWDGTAVTV